MIVASARACLFAAVLASLAALGCGEEFDGPTPGVMLPDARPDRPVPPQRFAPVPMPASPTVLPAPPRIVALGDVHGDVEAVRTVLMDAQIVDRAGRWVAGDTVVVQVGDQLDRGNDERIILDWFESLRLEAAEAGGAFLPLIGNHEVMNVVGNLTYVTAAGFAEFADIVGPLPADRAAPPPEQQGRAVAFAPGGPYARVLAEHNVYAVVGDTVFVHGGLSLAHVEYGLDRLNRETRAWMAGEAAMPALLYDGSGPLWIRTYGYEPLPEACAALDVLLAAVPAERLVVGHTVQHDAGVNSACDGRVWRVDVGLSAYYGGAPQALEIMDDAARPIGRP